VTSFQPKSSSGSEDRLVLLIDDDREARGVLHQELTRAGFRVAGVATVTDGLDFARRVRPDLIAIDSMMAGADGWSALASLKSDFALASVPVVIVNVIPDAGLVFQVKITDYLVKPLDSARLALLLDSEPGKNHVLVLSHDVAMLEMLVQLLAQRGRLSTLTRNGLDALFALYTTTPAAVLVDLTSPLKDVLPVLDALRSRNVTIGGLIPADPTLEERRGLDTVMQHVLAKGGLRVEAFVRELKGRFSRPT
jgi:DNA-binding response OmpR family regulator